MAPLSLDFAAGQQVLAWGPTAGLFNQHLASRRRPPTCGLQPPTF